MKLQTEITFKTELNQINYSSKLLLLGSCFSENIGEKINYYKFQNTINPFGVLFHPKAIETIVVNAVLGKEYDDESVFFYNEQWHCYDAHSRLSHANKDELLTTLNTARASLNSQIHEGSHIIITLGTAWVYRLIETNVIVANCHKVPQKTFRKELLSIEALVDSLEKISTTIKKVNNKATIIFTVSPVRHLKDGFVENTRSKAHLISAIHEVINKATGLQPFAYFPSFEIMMDTLRGYRFYKPDLLHPNETAINYIWDCFKKSWIDTETSKIMEEVEIIQKGLSHIPYNVNSQAHDKFVKSLEEKQRMLKNKIEHIIF